MADLLFEIGTEELPSWYVVQAHAAMAALLREKLGGLQFAFEDIHAFASPRRIAVIVRRLAERSAVSYQKRRGPAASVAFDEAGEPTRAARGFAAANDVELSELVTEDTERGRYLFIRKEVGGVAARAALPMVLAEVVAELPAPRKMRWGTVQTPFVRPVAWLLALLDSEVLPVHAAGLEAGGVSYGHRFLAPAAIVIDKPAHYLDALRRAKVLADLAEREEATWEAVRTAAGVKELLPLDDVRLRREVASLIEFPFGILGRFDESYLELPEEVLTTVMIHHQRFFPTRDRSGRLTPYFVGVSNNQAADEEVIRSGYQQVLAGRLYDARFFWDSDRRKSLSQHAWELSGITFHQDLGSMADKVARVGETARRLAESLRFGEESSAILEQALPIFRADLGTAMVYELPELEGVMACAYALAEGLPAAAAQVLEEGVLPKGSGGRLPTSSVGALLSLCDRFDKLVGFFALGHRPTGSTDPYGLRRDANALARILNAQGWRLPPRAFIAAAADSYRRSEIAVPQEVEEEVLEFLYDRVASLLLEQGIPTTLVRAALHGRPAVITAARRAHLLVALSQVAAFPELMTLYKRAANLAKEAGPEASVDPELFADPHEQPLFEALPIAKRGVDKLLGDVRLLLEPWDLGRPPAEEIGDLGEGLGLVLALKAPLDAFLDNVLVMVEDEAVRRNRLALLQAVRDTLRELGALEELEGLR